MKTPVSSIAIAVTFSAAMAFSGCGHRDVPALQTGKPCTVQFRRDALGAGATLPISPLTNSINGADTSVAGTLKRATPEWVVLERNGGEIWIPKSVILLIEQ